MLERLLFTAEIDDENIVFISDGSESGTIELVSFDTFGIGFGTAFTGNAVSTGELVFFTVGRSGFHEIWRTDGTAAGTFRLTDRDNNSWLPNSSVSVGTGSDGLIYFPGYKGDDDLATLWRTDGTVAGTIDLDVPTDVVLGVIGDNVIVASENTRQLFAYNVTSGTATNISDTGTNDEFTIRAAAGTYNGKVYFSGYYDNDTAGTELYATDGTPGGLELVADIHPTESSFPDTFVWFDGKLYFEATTPNDGSSVHVYDPAHGEQNTFFFDPFPGNFASVQEILPTSDGIFVSWFDSAEFSSVLWVTDGTPAGSEKLFENGQNRGDAFRFEVIGELNGGAFFLDGRRTSSDFGGVDFVVASDGTIEGTTSDFVDPLEAEGPNFFADSFGDWILWSYFTLDTGSELYAYDGTNNILIADLNPARNGGFGVTSLPKDFRTLELDISLTGSAAADALAGDYNANTMYGLGGNDTLRGLVGDDFIDGGEGKDGIFGGAGDDELYGGDDDDGVIGGSGSDLIFGGAGNDLLFGDSSEFDFF